MSPAALHAGRIEDLIGRLQALATRHALLALSHADQACNLCADPAALAELYQCGARILSAQAAQMRGQLEALAVLQRASTPDPVFDTTLDELARVWPPIGPSRKPLFPPL